MTVLPNKQVADEKAEKRHPDPLLLPKHKHTSDFYPTHSENELSNRERD